jgi:hypothetical protein
MTVLVLQSFTQTSQLMLATRKGLCMWTGACGTMSEQTHGGTSVACRLRSLLPLIASLTLKLQTPPLTTPPTVTKWAATAPKDSSMLYADALSYPVLPCRSTAAGCHRTVVMDATPAATPPC